MLSSETLERITSIAERSKILALGESIHTSDGMYQAKFEIIRHLIEKGEANCIFIENPWAWTEKVNSFLNSKASLEEAMSSFFGVWQSRSMAEFLQWLKQRKEAGYDIMVAGFDNQSMKEDLLILEEAGANWIHQEIVALLGESKNLFKEFHELMMDRFEKHGNREQLLEQFKGLADRIASLDIANSPRAYLARESISSYLRDRATYAFAVAEDDDDLARRAYEIRDEAMAFIANQYFNGKKTILWAHNLHIMRNGRRNKAWAQKSMGDYLCEVLDESFYKALALTAHNCDVNWPGHPENTGPPIPHPEDSIEEKLMKMGASERLVDFSNKEDELEFADCRKMFEAIDVENLMNHFDAVLYLKKSAAMVCFLCPDDCVPHCSEWHIH
jgi:erythromycin esterase